MFNLAQTYQIVEGKTSKADESGGRITLHFEGHSKYAFTAVIDAAAAKRFEVKRTAEEWQGVNVKIRGWLDRRRGPSIAVAIPDQIEILAAKMENGPGDRRAGP